jgi:hypothetical protein
MISKNNFILDFEFDGDLNKFIQAIKNGDCVFYNGKNIPINACIQGKNIILPLNSKNVIIDLKSSFEKLKKLKKVRITINLMSTSVC